MPYVAREGFALPGHRFIEKGQIVADDDPAVKGREALFDKVEDEAKKPRRVPKQKTPAAIEEGDE